MLLSFKSSQMDRHRYHLAKAKSTIWKEHPAIRETTDRDSTTQWTCFIQMKVTAHLLVDNSSNRVLDTIKMSVTVYPEFPSPLSVGLSHRGVAGTVAKTHSFNYNGKHRIVDRKAECLAIWPKSIIFPVTLIRADLIRS